MHTRNYFVVHSAAELEQRETEFAKCHRIHFTFPKTSVTVCTVVSLCYESWYFQRKHAFHICL
jgi:hypothetical protein